MEKELTYKGAVMTWECDSNRHMNVMYYINKFENAGRNFDIALGTKEGDTDPNLGVVVLEQNIKYLKEVFEDDLIHIKSGLLNIGNKAITIEHEMYNTRSKELVAHMKLVIVRFDKVTRKSLPFPPERRVELLKEWGIAE